MLLHVLTIPTVWLADSAMLKAQSTLAQLPHSGFGTGHSRSCLELSVDSRVKQLWIIFDLG